MSVNFTKVDNFSINGMTAITPNDTTVLTSYNEGLYIGGTGNVNITFRDGTTAVIAFVAGDMLRCRFTKISATSTTATSMYGLNLGE